MMDCHWNICAVESDETGISKAHVHEQDVGRMRFGLGDANRVFTERAVVSLQQRLNDRFGVPLVVRQGEKYIDIVHELVDDVGAERVLWSTRFEPGQAETDTEVANCLRRSGTPVEEHNTFLERDIRSLKVSMNGTRGHFGTMLPFLKSAQSQQQDFSTVVPEPSELPSPDLTLSGNTTRGLNAASELRLITMPKRRDGSVVDWGSRMMQHWDASEASALSQLQSFIDDGPLDRYENHRHHADGSAVSKLSPYLRHGLISSRTIQNELKKRNKNAQTFARRFVWRSLFYWLLWHWPTMPFRPIREAYSSMEWITGEEKNRRLKAWSDGMTGYPLVDAAMRELWETGWVQQSARMTAAAFLIEVLHVNWVDGMYIWHHRLVDGDLAINSGMWSSAAKAGHDPWQSVRQPTSNSQDLKGNYIRRWVPELAKLPTKYLTMPWEAPQGKLTAAGVQLGKTYPERVVKDVTGQQKKHSEAIRQVKRAFPNLSDDRGYDVIRVPTGSTDTLDGKMVRVFTKPEHRVPGNAVNERFESESTGSKRKQKSQESPSSKPVKGKQKRKQKRIEETVNGASVSEIMQQTTI